MRGPERWAVYLPLSRYVMSVSDERVGRRTSDDR